MMSTVSRTVLLAVFVVYCSHASFMVPWHAGRAAPRRVNDVPTLSSCFLSSNKRRSDLPNEDNKRKGAMNDLMKALQDKNPSSSGHMKPNPQKRYTAAQLEYFLAKYKELKKERQPIGNMDQQETKSTGESEDSVDDMQGVYLDAGSYVKADQFLRDDGSLREDAFATQPTYQSSNPREAMKELQKALLVSPPMAPPLDTNASAIAHEQVFAQEEGFLKQSKLFQEGLIDQDRAFQAMKERRGKRQRQQQQQALERLNSLMEQENLLRQNRTNFRQSPLQSKCTKCGAPLPMNAGLPVCRQCYGGDYQTVNQNIKRSMERADENSHLNSLQQDLKRHQELAKKIEEEMKQMRQPKPQNTNPRRNTFRDNPQRSSKPPL